MSQTQPEWASYPDLGVTVRFDPSRRQVVFVPVRRYLTAVAGVIAAVAALMGWMHWGLGVTNLRITVMAWVLPVIALVILGVAWSPHKREVVFDFEAGRMVASGPFGLGREHQWIRDLRFVATTRDMPMGVIGSYLDVAWDGGSITLISTVLEFHGLPMGLAEALGRLAAGEEAWEPLREALRKGPTSNMAGLAQIAVATVIAAALMWWLLA